MGLLFLYPTSKDETDYVEVYPSGHPLRASIKTYGLPWIFWCYAAAAVILLFSLTLSISGSINKLYHLGSGIDQILVLSLLMILLLTFLSILVFLYWRSQLTIGHNLLTLEFRPFGIKIKSKSISTEEPFELVLNHFLDSPNMARIHKEQHSPDFQNKGYFELIAKNKSHYLLIDRSSRKKDLEDLKDLLLHFIQK